MPDQHDRAVNSGDVRTDVLTVADHTAQRIGRSVTGEAEGLKPRDHIAPTGRIGERPVDQNNGGLVGRHRVEPLLHDGPDARTARQSGRSGFVNGAWTTAGSAGTPSETGRRPRTPRTHRPAPCKEDAARSPRRLYEGPEVHCPRGRGVMGCNTPEVHPGVQRRGGTVGARIRPSLGRSREEPGHQRLNAGELDEKDEEQLRRANYHCQSTVHQISLPATIPQSAISSLLIFVQTPFCRQCHDPTRENLSW